MMMEHIRQFDWCSTTSRDPYFVNEQDLDNCVTERILRNKFRDPMIEVMSDTEDGMDIDFSQVFAQINKVENKPKRVFVPGLRPVPKYPKLSALTFKQHMQCLKVLCSENPDILPEEFIPRPTKADHKEFQEVKELYEKEQQEYLEWAKTVWTTQQCVRALRPKNGIETMYESQFKIKANKMKSFPINYEMAAQIPLATQNGGCELVYSQELLSVNVDNLPKIEYPDLTKKTTILRPCLELAPCYKHPCKFILPYKKSISTLPFTEIQRELAQFAQDNGCQYIASESALKCLVEQDRNWSLPVTVSEVFATDGGKKTVLVLGSEFFVRREDAQTRTLRAFNCLLEHACVPPSERTKVDEKKEDVCETDSLDMTAAADLNSDSDDENSLIIDAGDEESQINTEAENLNTKDNKKNDEQKQTPEVTNDKSTDEQETPLQDEFSVCTCSETMYVPPTRSYTKWSVRSKSAIDQYNLVVHCSHKTRDENGEVILEPIPEYQLELGATKQSQFKVKSHALSMMLRRNATVVNVRVDGQSGDVVTVNRVTQDDLLKRHGDLRPEVADTVYSALQQLQGLLPGHYVLQHAPLLGTNALLYAPPVGGAAARPLRLTFADARTDADDASAAGAPPQLANVLLPYHKFRKILPCAFTTTEGQVAKVPNKPITRQKAPPQAIKVTTLTS